MKKLNLTKQLFWVRLAHRLNEIKILLNIDKGTFNRDTTRNYSWLETGKACSITNVIFRGSINTISCITSNGQIINLFKYIPRNFEKFLKFLKYIWDHFKEQESEAKEIGIILDNWVIHRSDKVKRFWRSIGVILYYLPPYCPELAPIELYFSQLKARLTKTIDGKEIDLRADAFVNNITKCI